MYLVCRWPTRPPYRNGGGGGGGRSSLLLYKQKKQHLLTHPAVSQEGRLTSPQGAPPRATHSPEAPVAFLGLHPARGDARQGAPGGWPQQGGRGGSEIKKRKIGEMGRKVPRKRKDES